MTIFKKLRIRKQLEQMLENFKEEKHSLAKDLAPARNAYWMYYEPNLYKHIGEINYSKIHYSLNQATEKISKLENSVKDIKTFYKNTIIAYKQEHHDAVDNLNLRLEQLYDDIHSIIINLSSLTFNPRNKAIEETINHLKIVQTRFIILLKNNGVNVPSLEVTSKEKGTTI